MKVFVLAMSPRAAMSDTSGGTGIRVRECTSQQASLHIIFIGKLERAFFATAKCEKHIDCPIDPRATQELREGAEYIAKKSETR
jgi:hypothetical protein